METEQPPRGVAPAAAQPPPGGAPAAVLPTDQPHPGSSGSHLIAGLTHAEATVRRDALQQAERSPIVELAACAQIIVPMLEDREITVREHAATVVARMLEDQVTCVLPIAATAIPTLMRRLQSEDVATICETLQYLAKMPALDLLACVNRIVRLRESEDAEVRRCATKVVAVSHDDWFVRRQALFSLANLQPLEAQLPYASAYVRLLEDIDLELRIEAAGFLAKLLIDEQTRGAPIVTSAMPKLMHKLTDKVATKRWEALQCLHEMPVEQLVSHAGHIALLLEDHDGVVRRDAATVVAKMLKDERSRAVPALQEVIPNLISGLLRADWRARCAALKSLVRMPIEHVLPHASAILHMLSDDVGAVCSEAATLVAKMLAQPQSQDQVPALQATIPALVMDVVHADWKQRYNALQCLMKMSSMDLLPHVVALVPALDADEEYLRRDAAKLFARLMTDPDTCAEAAVTGAISKPIKDLMHKDWQVRCKALRQLELMPVAQLIPHAQRIARMLDDGNIEVQIAADALASKMVADPDARRVPAIAATVPKMANRAMVLAARAQAARIAEKVQEIPGGRPTRAKPARPKIQVRAVQRSHSSIA